MSVVPVKSLFYIIAIWLVVDLTNFWLVDFHPLTASEITEKTFFELALVLCAWGMRGRQVPA